MSKSLHKLCVEVLETAVDNTEPGHGLAIEIIERVIALADGKTPPSQNNLSVTDMSMQEAVIAILENESDRLSAAVRKSLVKLVDRIRQELKGRPIMQRLPEDDIRERTSPIFLPGSPKTPDQLKEHMKAVYDWQKQSLSQFGFLSDVGDNLDGNAPLPSFEQAMSVFSADQLEAVLHFDEPKLILIPDMPFSAKVQAFNSHKPQGIENIIVADPFPTQNESGSNQITGWRSSIVEGILRKTWFQHPDDIWNRLKFRMEKKKQGISSENIKKGMDRDKWMMLMMMWLSKGCQIDSEFITILDEDVSTKEGKVMIGFFRKDLHTANIIWQPDTETLMSGRFRSSVEGGQIIL